MADNDVRIKISADGAETTAKGLRGVGDAASDADSKTSKLGSGLRGVATAFTVFAGAAVATGGALLGAVGTQYAAYEQNVGGIETLFKGSADKMMGYAADAYKTAGLSANQYMEQVTSFSASLLAGLGGDTDKAADVANRAMTDMADNANKFGTNIASIQYAYQGFAKQNYTMLDNLKLGYGGTQAEMARLINDSGVLGDTMTVTAETVNQVSFDKIIEAIGKVQDEMGITGTTAKEAASTITGSVDSMKAAWANLLTGLGDADADIVGLANNVINSVQTVISNITPLVQNIGKNMQVLAPQMRGIMQTLVQAVSETIPVMLDAGTAMIDGLLQGIATTLPGLITALVPALAGLVNTVLTLTPQLLNAGVAAALALIQGVTTAIPGLTDTLQAVIPELAIAIQTGLPLLVEAALQLVGALADGIVAALPVLLDNVALLIPAVLGQINLILPQLIIAGLEIITALSTGLINALPLLFEGMAQVGAQIYPAVLQQLPLIIAAGIQLFLGLVQALATATPQIVQALTSMWPLVLNAITAALPQIIDSGTTVFLGMVQAITAALPSIVQAVVMMQPQITAAVISMLPALFDAANTLFLAIVRALPVVIPQVLSSLRAMGPQMASSVLSIVPALVSAGGDLVAGVARGIINSGSSVVNAMLNIARNALNAVKNALGIASPSKVMSREVGQWIPAGIGQGATQNEDAAIRPIRDINARMVDEAMKLNTYAVFTHDSNLSYTPQQMPLLGTPQQSYRSMPAPITLDTTGFSTLFEDMVNEMASGPDSVSLDRGSINALAAALVDAMRASNRQGVSNG